MPIYGDLRTLPLQELLRLASSTAKTGVLEVERNGIARRVEFRKGHVGSCSSNDPSSRLGQVLLYRERINEVQLQHLLTLQEATGKRLGLLLVEMGILSRQELASEVAFTARETIYGLFDWEDAYFRFDDGATLDPDQIEVTLSVDELITEGLERKKRLALIRETFASSGVVLGVKNGELPEALFAGPVTRRTFDSIDGRRTLAEILLHARAPEFVTLDFLARLYDQALLEIREVRPVPEGVATLLDPPTKRKIEEQEEEEKEQPRQASPGSAALVNEIEQAAAHMERHDYEAAVELLRAACLEHATDYARSLLVKAETALVEDAWADDSFGEKFPVLVRDRNHSEDPAPDEAFLMTMIDGMTDLRAIVWLTPMREVDVIIALKRMVAKGMIELADPSRVECLVPAPA